MLIAIMGDSYGRVSENQDVEARLARARVLVDIDNTWYTLIAKLWGKQVCYPRCLHVLTPDKDDGGGGDGGGNDDGWAGRMEILRARLSSEMRTILDEKGAAADGGGGDKDVVKKLKAQLDGVVTQMGANKEELNGKLDGVLGLLAKLSEANHHPKKTKPTKKGGDGKKKDAEEGGGTAS